MATTVQKWGNSLGVRIPKAIAERVNLERGTPVEFDVAGDTLVIRPKRRRRHTLRELLARMKPRHRHGEIHKDAPRGREVL